MRGRRPFTAKGAQDARVPFATHVICGDFNAHPGQHATQNGWSALLSKAVKTSSGDKAYDNFVVNADADTVFFAHSSVMVLADVKNSRLGKPGLSDHDPIALTLTEIRRR
jgi:endonuclease/exonuclease/phosphatase family metal-dependent hydrolase